MEAVIIDLIITDIMFLKKTHFLFFILTFSVIVNSSCSNSEKNQPSNSQEIKLVYSAIDDFYDLEKQDFKPFYIDEEREVLAIDAAIFKDAFAAAEVLFTGTSGTYELTFYTMTEIDGESTYRILINNKLVEEFQNPETENDFELIPHFIESIEVRNGDKIQIEFNSHSNGKIPEDGAFAFSRGRWKGIELVKIK
ncbi:MAG: hypothetical protein BalsKO_10780 [Balneolaceae bacterium]